MKKLLVLTLVVAMAFFGTNAFAGALTGVNLDATAGPKFDASIKTNGSLIPTWGGISSGVAISGGASELNAAGGVLFGSAYINSENDPAISNAVSGAESNSFKTGGGFIGPNGTVGTNASAGGSAVNSLTVGVKGLGLVGGEFHGAAGEATAVQSALANIGPLNATQGHTDVQGAQGGIGGYIGIAGAAFCGTAHADASLLIEGESNVVSGRTGGISNGGVYESLSSAGYVTTDVTASKNTSRTGLGAAAVTGGWIAGGALTMDAHQTGNFQPSSANATAVGTYGSSGNMNKSYSGSAIGGVATQITQYPNAVMVQSSGYMAVTSN